MHFPGDCFSKKCCNRDLSTNKQYHDVVKPNLTKVSCALKKDEEANGNVKEDSSRLMKDDSKKKERSIHFMQIHHYLISITTILLLQRKIKRRWQGCWHKHDDLRMGTNIFL